MSSNFLPEELARKKIDMMLKKAGWDIVSRDKYSSGMSAVAIEEGLLKGNLDYYSQFYLSFKDFEIVNTRVHNLS